MYTRTPSDDPQADTVCSYLCQLLASSSVSCCLQHLEVFITLNLIFHTYFFIAFT
jgi:hypothetical protein